jgi:hypothetical protein
MDVLAIFLAKGGQISNEWVKTHLSKVLSNNAPVVNIEQYRAVQINAPGSTAHSKFRTPFAFRPLSKGGGGGGSGIGGASLQRPR